MLGILQGFVNPGLQYFRVHLNLLISLFEPSALYSCCHGLRLLLGHEIGKSCLVHVTFIGIVNVVSIFSSLSSILTFKGLA
jgi:hypothetical protein